MVASSRAAIKDAVGVEPEYTTGRRGQFRVSVDGETVLERKGGVIQWLMRVPWPNLDDVVGSVRRAADRA